MDIDPRLVGAVIATLVLVLAIVAATAKPSELALKTSTGH